MGWEVLLPRERLNSRNFLRSPQQQTTCKRTSWPRLLQQHLVEKPVMVGSVLQTSSSVRRTFLAPDCFRTLLFFTRLASNPGSVLGACMRRQSIENPVGCHGNWLARTSGRTTKDRSLETSDHPYFLRIDFRGGVFAGTRRWVVCDRNSSGNCDLQIHLRVLLAI